MSKAAMLLAWAAIGLFAAPQVSAKPGTPVAYRCSVPSGEGEGADRAKIRYQHHACEGGQAMLDRDQRTDAQRRDTSRAAQTDAQLAHQLQRERRHLERQTQGQRPTAMDSPKPRRQGAADRDKTKVYPLKRTRHFKAKVPTPDTPKAKATQAGKTD